MNRKFPQFDDSSCLSCSICVQACPLSCLKLSKAGKQGKYRNLFPELIKKAECIGCGICAGACPMSCIALKNEE